MLRTDIITKREEFEDLRNDWNALLATSTTNTIFLTWEWLYSWWEVFGESSQLFIVTVRTEGGGLIGLAPLFIRRSRYYQFYVKELAFIGKGLSDRQDFIIRDGEMAAIDEIMLAIEQRKSAWDIVHLDEIPEESALATYTYDANLTYEKEYASVCPYVRIRGSWDEYLKKLSKKFQRDIKHKTNRIARFGHWSFGTKSIIEDPDAMMSMMSEIEAKSRKENSGTSMLWKDQTRAFLRKFCKRAAEHNWIDFTQIAIDQRPVAYLLGFMYNSRYHAYNMAFSEEYHEASPGKLLLNEKMKWCFDHAGAVQEFDFSRGDTYLKALWEPERRRHVRIVLFKRALYHQVVRMVVFKARPAIKRVLASITQKLTRSRMQEKGKVEDHRK